VVEKARLRVEAERAELVDIPHCHARLLANF
jgi:hypothetical protein